MSRASFSIKVLCDVTAFFSRQYYDVIPVFVMRVIIINLNFHLNQNCNDSYVFHDSKCF